MSNHRLMLVEALLWRWMQVCINNPRTMLGVLLALCMIGFAIPAAGFLGINTDTSQMVSSSLPHRQAQIEFERAFPDEENRLAVIVRARSPDEADAFSEKLVGVLGARDDAISDIFAPNLDPFLTRNGLLYLESNELDETLGKMSQAAPIISRLGREPDLPSLYDAIADGLLQEEEGVLPEATQSAFVALSATIEARLSGEPKPLSWQSIFAPEPDNEIAARQRVISVAPVLDPSRVQPARPAVRAIKAAVLEAADDPDFDVEVGITGTQALRFEELSAVIDGIGLSLALSFVGVAILLFLTFRDYLLVATSLASLVVSIGITAGFASLIYTDLNLVSVAFLVLMVGLGIDFAIHLGLHVEEERCAGHRSRPALYRTTRFVGAALVLCAPTSALAFFAFSPTHFTGMAQLGIVSGVGVLVAFFVSITILPAVFALKPKSRRAPRPIIEHSARAAQLPRIGAIRSGAAIFVIVMGIGSLGLMSHIRFDADPMNLRDPKAQSVTSFDWLFEEENSQPFNLSVLEAGEDAALATAERLEALPEVADVVTLASFVPEDLYEKLDIIDIASIGLETAFEPNDRTTEIEEGEPTPRERMLEGLAESGDDASARLLSAFNQFGEASANNAELQAALAGDVFRFWPSQYERLQALIYPDEITLEELPEPIKDRYVGEDDIWRVVVQPKEDLRDAEARSAFVDAVRDAEPRAAGSARSVLESGRVISKAMLTAVSLALVTVTILLYLVLRDVTLVSVILFTLILAGVLTSAAAVVFGMSFNFANIIALPLLIGVGADSGIHLGMRARRSDDAAQVYETSTPRAVFCSAMTTMVSFWTLSLSAHKGVQSMGIILTLAIGMTLLCTLLVQPWLLEKFGQRDPARPDQAA